MYGVRIFIEIYHPSMDICVMYFYSIRDIKFKNEEVFHLKIVIIWTDNYTCSKFWERSMTLITVTETDSESLHKWQRDGE